MIRLPAAIPMKYLQKSQADFGIDNLVAAGVDTMSVWHGPCQHWWQLGLTSSQSQPESSTASVTSCSCGECVMGDCLAGSINRHHCPARQWGCKIPLMQIFTYHMKEIHFFSHRPHTDASRKKNYRVSHFPGEIGLSRGRGAVRRDLLPRLQPRDPVNINYNKHIGSFNPTVFCHHAKYMHISGGASIEGARAPPLLKFWDEKKKKKNKI